MPTRPRGAVLMLLIAISKLVEAALLVAVAMGLGHLLKHGVEDSLTEWVHAVRVDPDNRYVQKLVVAVVNLLIVVYLVVRLWRGDEKRAG